MILDYETWRDLVLEQQTVLDAVRDEWQRQVERFKQQNWPNGTATDASDHTLANLYRTECEVAAQNKRLTWAHILREEVYEALAESDPRKLRAELVQVAAVAANWISCIDRKLAAETVETTAATAVTDDLK